MRLRAVLAVAALLLPLGACTSSSDAPEVSTLPEVTLARFDAPGEVDLASVRGPAVVNLWASWCGPCREELPVVQAFHERYGDEVEVIGIDYQDVQVDAARDLAEASGLDYTLLTDPDGTLDGAPPFPALQGLPFWAFVDAEGRVTHREFVAVDSLAQLRALTREHLGVRL